PRPQPHPAPIRDPAPPPHATHKDESSQTNRSQPTQRAAFHRPSHTRRKSKSYTNALKHGLTAAQIILPDESGNEFEEHAAQFRDKTPPSTPTEHTLVNKSSSPPETSAEPPSSRAPITGSAPSSSTISNPSVTSMTP